MINTPSIGEISLTRRIILGIINKPHDLLGLISPITVRMMAAYRDLFRNEPCSDWDKELTLKQKTEWIELFGVLSEVANVSFPRATRPKSAISGPELIGYFDGSDNAYAAVVYLRWVLSNGSIHACLAGSKAKVTPLKRISTPRSELNGAVLLGRLALSVTKACVASGATPERVWLLGDSECTLASLEKTSGSFREYFGNRVGDIHDNQARIQNYCPVGDNGEWYQVSSSDNAADQPTRLDSTALDIGLGSVWQHAPDYIYSPRKDWPTNRRFAERKDSHIPSCEILRKYRGIIHRTQVVVSRGIHVLIDPHSTNDWDKLIQRSQFLLKSVQTLLRLVIDSDATRLELAERLWFLSAMKETVEAQQAGRLKSLCIEEKDRLLVVTGRAKNGLQKFFGKNSPSCHGIIKSCFSNNALGTQAKS